MFIVAAGVNASLSVFFTSADNFQPGAILMNRLRIRLSAKMTVRIGVTQVADVLHTLPQGRQVHRGHLECRVVARVLCRAVSLTGDAAQVAGAGETRPAGERITVQGRVGGAQLTERQRRTRGRASQLQLTRSLRSQPVSKRG